MGLDVTVAVSTYGANKWAALARKRALPSALAQTERAVHVHGDTLHEARNCALADVTTEWVCFLDADDELADGYMQAMERSTADLRAPAVRFEWRGFQPKPAAVPKVAGHTHDCNAECLDYGNWLVIGTLVRADLVRDVGGFRDWPMYEDWDLWVRCWQAGASVEAVPDAVYIAHGDRDSRNRGPGRDQRLAAHQAIARANGLPVPQ